ncbi:MAG: sigma-70 family RNA polymerase sigma factor [Myxococcota bacterium]
MTRNLSFADMMGRRMSFTLQSVRVWPLRGPQAKAKADVGRIYREQADFIWRSARRLGLDEAAAEDATQEVFLVVQRRIGELVDERGIRTWLYRILRNVVRNVRRADERRRLDRRAEVVEAIEAAPASSRQQPEQLAEARAAREVLYAVLAELDEGPREAFILAELEGMTGPEIATATGVKLNTVYARIRRGRAQFEGALSRRKTEEQE